MIIDKNIVELFEKAQKGDREAVTSIVEDNIGLVYKQAKKFKGKAISYDDAIQVGSLGLLHSIQNYDPELGIKFSTYATSNIIGKIMHTVRDHREDVPFRIPRKNFNEYRQIKQIRKEFEKMQREPTLKELSEIMGITIEEITKTLHLMEGKIPMDSTMKVSKHKTKAVKFSETLESNNISEDQIIFKIDIPNAIKKLPEREKLVIIKRFYEEKSQSEIGKELQTSQAQIHRIEKIALKNLKDILNGKNIEILDLDKPVARKYKYIDMATTDLSCLTERQKKCVDLVFGEGLTQAEAGKILGVSKHNVYAAITEVMKKLEKKKIS